MKNFIGNKNGKTVKPLCIIEPQMSGVNKYFKKNKKGMSFFADEDDAILKYSKIWKKIKKLISIEFEQPACLRWRIH